MFYPTQRLIDAGGCDFGCAEFCGMIQFNRSSGGFLKDRKMKMGRNLYPLQFLINATQPFR